MSKLSVECLYHAVPLYLGETKVKRRYPTASMLCEPVLFVPIQDRR